MFDYITGMVAFFRRYLALILALAVILTGHEAAVARGANPVANIIEICTGTTIKMMAVDAEGQPVETRHICPDVVASLFVAEGGAYVAPEPESLWVTMPRVAEVTIRSRQATLDPQARGPPLSV